MTLVTSWAQRLFTTKFHFLLLLWAFQISVLPSIFPLQGGFSKRKRPKSIQSCPNVPVNRFYEPDDNCFHFDIMNVKFWVGRPGAWWIGLNGGGWGIFFLHFSYEPKKKRDFTLKVLEHTILFFKAYDFLMIDESSHTPNGVSFVFFFLPSFSPYYTYVYISGYERWKKCACHIIECNVSKRMNQREKKIFSSDFAFKNPPSVHGSLGSAPPSVPFLPLHVHKARQTRTYPWINLSIRPLPPMGKDFHPVVWRFKQPLPPRTPKPPKPRARAGLHYIFYY